MHYSTMFMLDYKGIGNAKHDEALQKEIPNSNSTSPFTRLNRSVRTLMILIKGSLKVYRAEFRWEFRRRALIIRTANSC